MQKIYILCILLFSLHGFGQNKLDVYFDFNKDVPNEASQIKINQWVLDNKTAEITKILGYCDSVDDSKYNKDLAMRRVTTMITIFTNNNIKIADKVELKSFGKDFKSSKSQSDNRKVEVFYNVITAKNGNAKNTKTIPDGPFGRKQVKEVITEDKVEEDLLEVGDMDAYVEEERSTLESKFYKIGRAHV